MSGCYRDVFTIFKQEPYKSCLSRIVDKDCSAAWSATGVKLGLSGFLQR